MASHTAQLCQIDGQTKMVVFGGTGMPFGSNLSNNVYLCDISNDFNWKTMTVSTDSQMPHRLYGQALVVDSKTDSLYTVGGTSGFHYFMDVHRLNLHTRAWELVIDGIANFEAHHEISPSPR